MIMPYSHVYDVGYLLKQISYMNSGEESGRWASDEVTGEPAHERLDALEEQAARVQQNIEEMDLRRRDMEKQRDEACKTLAKALGELQRVKGELKKVHAEVRGMHEREYRSLEEKKKLKDSNKRLQEEVLRLDKVALGLENELSAAELALEKKEEGMESWKALEDELAVALHDIQSKEWRIDDLVAQTGDLRECILEYQGKLMDMERRNEYLVRALEESESNMKQSSVASLQIMDNHRSDMKYVVSKEGSNATLEHVVGRNGDQYGVWGASDMRVYSTTPDTPESRMDGFSEILPRNGISREGSMLADLEARLSDLELEYSGARSLCEALKRENATLKSKQVEMKNENRRTIELALERIEEESKGEIEDLLKKQKDLEQWNATALEKLSKEKKSLEDALQDMVQKTATREEATRAALDTARANVEEGRLENIKLTKEKEALCGVIEELKQALSLAEQRFIMQKIDLCDKENPTGQNTRLQSPQKTMQALSGVGRGTPLRSLAVNVIRE